jgi:tRNA dimethylallyltransferase
VQPPVHRPLVVIVGPTAVGKTEIALLLAERLGGEIVSADSRLFYRGMDIGTAKPSAQELSRAPHHLIDVVSPDDTWSLAIFQREAREAIADIHARKKLPFLVGGTGQYVLAVIEGWEVPPQQPDPHLREALERWAEEVGPYGLHARLNVVDPQAAHAIDARNVRRTIRALEVIFNSGQRFSEQRRRTSSPYSVLTVGLMRPRAELYQRVDARIDAMLEAGFVDEVRGLLDRGYSENLPTMSAIGYREIAAYIRGKMTLEDAVMQIKRLTRRYVRQQANWFKQEDPNIHWFQIGPQTVSQVETLIRSGEGWKPAEDLSKRFD